MTSLAAQLQSFKGAEPRSRKIPSLLYSHEQASDIDLSAACDIGSNGLDALQARDSSFEAYASLFGAASQEVSRLMIQKAENDKLDAKINSFLRHVSPYFLLPCASQALEWLLRRFHIHEHNYEAFLECALPYHETKLFVRVVQLLNIPKESKYFFLENVKKNGVPLEKGILVIQCLKSSVLLEAVLDMPFSALKESNPPSSITHLVSLTTSLLAGALEGQPPSDNFVASIMPYLIECLKCGHAQLLASAHIAISSLAVRTSLSKPVVERLVTAVSRLSGVSMSPRSAISCVVLLAQSQGLECLPDKAISRLLQYPLFLSHLVSLSDAYSLDGFLPCFLKAYLKHDMFKPEDLKTMLGALPLSPKMALVVGKLMWQQWVELQESADDVGDPQEIATIQTVLGMIEARRATSLDELIRTLSSSPDVSQELVHRFMALAVSSSRYHTSSNSQSALFFSLQHPEGSVRALAMADLKTLLDQTDLATLSPADKQFFEQMIRARLADEDSFVIMATLALGGHLVALLDPEALLAALLPFLAVSSKALSERVEAAAQLLAVPFLASHPQLTPRVARHFLQILVLTSSKKRTFRSVLKVVTEAPLGENFFLFKGLAALQKNVEEFSKLKNLEPSTILAVNDAILNLFAQNILKGLESEPSEVLSFIDEVSTTRDPRALAFFISSSNVFLMSLVSAMVSLTADSSPALSLISLLSKSIARLALALHVHPATKISVTELPLLPASRLPSKFIPLIAEDNSKFAFSEFRGLLQFYALQVLVSSLAPSFSSANSDVELKAVLRDVFMAILGLPNVSCFQASASHLFSKISLCDCASFLLEECLAPSVSALCQFRTLNIVSVYFTSQTDLYKQSSEKGSKLDDSVIVPFVLLAVTILTSSNSSLRDTALDCLGSINDFLSSSASSFEGNALVSLLRSFVFRLLVERGEIKLDGSHIVGLCTRLLVLPSNKTKPVPAKASAKRLSSSSSPNMESTTLLACFVEHALACENLEVASRILQVLQDANDEDKISVVLPRINALLERAPMTDASHISSQTAEARSFLKSSEQDFLGTLLGSLTCPALLAHLRQGAPSRTLSSPDRHLSAVTTIIRCLDFNCQEAWGTPASIVLSRIVCQSLLDSLPIADQVALFHALVALRQDASSVVSPLESAVDSVFGFLKIPVQVYANDLRAALLGSRDTPYAFDATAPACSMQTPSKVNSLPKGTSPGEPKGKKAKVAPELEGNSGDTALAQVSIEQDSVIWISNTLDVTLAFMSNITEAHLMVSPLFDLLGHCLDDTHHSVPLDHLIQQTLTTILSLLRNISPSTLIEEHFNVELIVRCIRQSSNPQTHSHCLLLLAAIAELYPSRVIHSIMPIFTFMGSTFLRQDDNYSFQIIQQTIRTIIPAVIKSESNSASGASLNAVTNFLSADDFSLPSFLHIESLVTSVIGIFVDTLFHIPKHRRLTMFHEVLSTLQSPFYIFVAVVLLLKKLVVDPKAKPSSGSGSSNASITEASSAAFSEEDLQDFIAGVLTHFAAVDQLAVMILILKLLRSLPSVKPEGKAPKSFPENIRILFDPYTYSAKQLKAFKFRTAAFLSSMFSLDDFLRALVRANSPSAEPSVVPAFLSLPLEKLHLNLLHLLLKVITHSKSQQDESKRAKDAYVEFWSHYLGKLYEMLDKVGVLLSNSDFVDVITNLIMQSDSKIRQKALSMLNERIESAQIESEADATCYLRILDNLCALFASNTSLDTSGSFIVQQYAALSVDVIVCKLAKELPARFGAVLEIFSQKIGALATLPADHAFWASQDNWNFVGTVSASLASLFLHLGTAAVATLPTVFPGLLSILAIFVQNYQSPTQGQEMSMFNDSEKQTRASGKIVYSSRFILINSIFSAINTILQALPQFSGPYVEQTLSLVLHPYLRFPISNSHEKSKVARRVESIKVTIATKVPPRLVLTPLFNAFALFLGEGKKYDCQSFVDLISILTEAVRGIPAKDVVATYSTKLLRFYLDAFDFRLKFKTSEAESMADDDQGVTEESDDEFEELSNSDDEADDSEDDDSEDSDEDDEEDEDEDEDEYEDSEGDDTDDAEKRLGKSSSKPMQQGSLDDSMGGALREEVVSANAVEHHLALCFAEYVLKLSENTFRPMLLKIVEWGTSADAPLVRVCMFYRLIDHIAFRLKKLFVPYFGHIFTHMVSLLEQSEALSLRFVSFIVTSLNTCFTYDEMKLISKDKFELLHKSVIDLLNYRLDEPRTARALQAKLVPCLGQFAVALTHDRNLWKPLNTCVLNKLRDPSPLVRKGALLVLEQFYDRLGEEFLELLPQTVPFLAELLEDDSSQVEKACRSLISKIELILGEPLQKYF